MGGTTTSATLEEGLDYAADGPAAGHRLLGLTRRELAGDSLALGAGIVPAAWPQPMLGWLLARPEPIPARTAGRIKVGESDVAAIRTTVELFMRMDFQFGGGHARAALAQYFAGDVCPLLDGSYTDHVSRVSSRLRLRSLSCWAGPRTTSVGTGSRSGTSSRGSGWLRPPATG